MRWLLPVALLAAACSSKKPTTPALVFDGTTTTADLLLRASADGQTPDSVTVAAYLRIKVPDSKHIEASQYEVTLGPAGAAVPMPELQPTNPDLLQFTQGFAASYSQSFTGWHTLWEVSIKEKATGLWVAEKLPVLAPTWYTIAGPPADIHGQLEKNIPLTLLWSPANQPYTHLQISVTNATHTASTTMETPDDGVEPLPAVLTLYDGIELSIFRITQQPEPLPGFKVRGQLIRNLQFDFTPPVQP